MRLYSAENEKTIGFAVHDAALAIDIELDSHVTLGGNAITVASPEWDEVSISDYPPGSGIGYVKQVGSMDITVDYVLRCVRSGPLRGETLRWRFSTLT